MHIAGLAIIGVILGIGELISGFDVEEQIGIARRPTLADDEEAVPSSSSAIDPNLVNWTFCFVSASVMLFIVWQRHGGDDNESCGDVDCDDDCQATAPPSSSSSTRKDTATPPPCSPAVSSPVSSAALGPFISDDEE